MLHTREQLVQIIKQQNATKYVQLRAQRRLLRQQQELRRDNPPCGQENVSSGDEAVLSVGARKDNGGGEPGIVSNEDTEDPVASVSEEDNSGDYEDLSVGDGEDLSGDTEEDDCVGPLVDEDVYLYSQVLQRSGRAPQIHRRSSVRVMQPREWKEPDPLPPCPFNQASPCCKKSTKCYQYFEGDVEGWRQSLLYNSATTREDMAAQLKQHRLATAGKIPGTIKP